MDKFKNFMIVSETKEGYDKLENDINYFLVKKRGYFSYYRWFIFRELEKYLVKNKILLKKFDEVVDIFRYYDGKPLKLVVDEENKIIKRYILYRGRVKEQYAESNKKFLTEIFNLQNGQYPWIRINNYMEFEVNNEILDKQLIDYFEKDVIEINKPYEMGFVDQFTNIKIDSPRVKNILKNNDRFELKIDLYSQVNVNIDEEMENNKIDNLKMNVINVDMA